MFSREKVGKVKILGQPLATRELVVGPFRDPNLPWVLLGRARLFYRLVAERNHARRDAIILLVEDSGLAAGKIDDDLRRTLDRYFAAVRDDATQANAAQLSGWLLELLQQDIASV